MRSLLALVPLALLVAACGGGDSALDYVACEQRITYVGPHRNYDDAITIAVQDFCHEGWYAPGETEERVRSASGQMVMTVFEGQPRSLDTWRDKPENIWPEEDDQ